MHDMNIADAKYCKEHPTPQHYSYIACVCVHYKYGEAKALPSPLL